MAQAEAELASKDSVDTVIRADSHERLLGIGRSWHHAADAFDCDDIRGRPQGISDLDYGSPEDQPDFADVRPMTGWQAGADGNWRGGGRARAVIAAQKAISSPLLRRHRSRRQGVLIILPQPHP